MITVLVFAGLWLMHGVSASTGAGCHAGAMPLIAAMSSAQGAMAAAAEAPATEAPAADSRAPVAGPAAMGAGPSGELCLSAQPTDPGAALIGLIALMALAGWILLDGAAPARARAAACRARRWRGPPGRTGVALLTVVCVSRT